MRKQELIHFHGLLVAVSDYCEADGVPVDMSSYRDQETRPTSIHRSKTDHKEAVFTLAESITASLADEPIETFSASAD